MPEKITPQPTSETANNKDAWLKELTSQKTRDLILAYIWNMKLRLPSEDTEDIVQQVMLKATRAIKAGKFKGIDQFRGNSPLIPWLYTITKNQARDLLRRKKIRNIMISLPDTYEFASHEPTSEEKYIGAETAKRLSSHFNNLPPELKEVLELRAKGLEFQQIAEQLNVNLNTVKSRQHYAVERLKEWMQKEDEK